MLCAFLGPNPGTSSNETSGQGQGTRICDPCDHADMCSKLKRLLCLLALALPASAQFDSAQVRVKFGSPLNREIFGIPPGFDLVVDYGGGNRVCKLQVIESRSPIRGQCCRERGVNAGIDCG